MSQTTNDAFLQRNELWKLLIDELDVPDSKYEDAENRYKAVGEWLCRRESIVANFSPEIYLQGSFRLGTAVKPVVDTDEYDIDSVCELQLKKTQVSQKQLKELVGSEVKAYAKANSMNHPAKEGKRCWTLNYADDSRFHMDILPALPDSTLKMLLEKHGFVGNLFDSAIAITDQKHPTYSVTSDTWPQSNPKGYAKWFRGRMRVFRQKLFAENRHISDKYASVEDVPDYTLKTPLQRVIQILKRHRDITFQGRDNKPISIIITTLAALAYQNEDDIETALRNIVDHLDDGLKQRSGVWWLPNPASPLENFAEKWKSEPQLATAFFTWHNALKILLTTMTGSAVKGLNNISEGFEKIAGKPVANAVMNRYGQKIANARTTGDLFASPATATLSVGAGATKVAGHTFYGS